MQRGNGELWENLHDNAVWLDLNPELKDAVYPPLGARVQERRFMEPTLETLKACPASATECRSHPKPLPRRPNTAAPTPPTFVDLQDEDHVEDEHEAAPPRPMKRSHAEMAKEHEVFLRNHRKRNSQHKRQNGGRDRPAPNSARAAHPRSVGREGPPPHPIHVAPIATRSPSPDRDVFRFAHSLHVVTPPDIPLPSDSTSDDMILGLRKDRHAFHKRAANAARTSVKMENPKPTLRPPIQPPGLFHLMACGLLTFDLERGEFQAFEDKVQK